MMECQVWICPDCHQPISNEVYPCPVCQSKYRQIPKSSNKNKCKCCTYANHEQLQSCQMCGQPLDNPIPLQLKKSVVTCKNCHQQNDLVNEVCVYCQNDLYQTNKITCDICNLPVKEQHFKNHYSGCLLSKQIIEQQAKQELKYQEEQTKKMLLELGKNLEECLHCRSKFTPEDMKAHLPSCMQKSSLGLEIDQKTRMTKLQLQAITYMRKKSEGQHLGVRTALQARIKLLGYSIEDLNNLQFYIENYAPIIIHIHIAKHMEFFIKDTHYRSQFETNKSSGSLSRPSRVGWEDRMFDKKYSKAKDCERVKYGVINFTNDPKGVNCCSGYGPSYFLLKQPVRQRCTFTDKDSSAADAAIATFKYCFKILSKMNDAELKAAFEASKAMQVASGCIVTYKEIQIHGPIQFSKDIQRIYINRNEVKDKRLLDMTYQFCKKNKIDYDFIEVK